MQLYGQVDSLYEAVRARAPQVEAARVHPGPLSAAKGQGGVESAEPTRYMRVSYGSSGPRRIIWDASLETYRWDSGPGIGARLGSDPSEAAARIARTLGAPLDPAPTAE
ncbi:hypothetical protein [Actinomadura decatromicini]|uniref:Uncharacterized protein n=1 Tax=Actinomadura decatromicini TaxID=2604572 RepID=A0A5D3FG71_9ACTN|nr:hypothetical protein [Actinomadura decatromicini]TYK46846.1 hypothetical protein FXF68_23730 [Actinomadura decatromicini]